MKLSGWYHSKFNHNEFFAQTTWVTLYPFIYHPAGVQNVYNHWRIVAHELVHFNRQRAKGVWLWAMCYLASWKFRWYEERYAYLRDLYTGRHTIETATRELRSPLYGIKLESVEISRWLSERFGEIG